jgi:hypothetical protein
MRYQFTEQVCTWPDSQTRQQEGRQVCHVKCLETKEDFYESNASFSRWIKVFEEGQVLKLHELFLISNFRHVLNAVYFLMGNFPVSEFLWRRFGTLCPIFIGG